MLPPFLWALNAFFVLSIKKICIWRKPYSSVFPPQFMLILFIYKKNMSLRYFSNLIFYIFTVKKKLISLRYKLKLKIKLIKTKQWLMHNLIEFDDSFTVYIVSAIDKIKKLLWKIFKFLIKLYHTCTIYFVYIEAKISIWRR